MESLHAANENGKSPTVFVKDGSAYTGSREVAEFFSKRHDNVLNDIDALFLETKEQGMFKPAMVETKTGFGVRAYRAYDITKDGFTLLAMGFTGPKALKFKLAYIATFNALEAELRRRDEDEQQIIPYTPESESRLLVGQAQRTFGPKAAQELWGLLGLPVVPSMLIPQPQMEFSFTGSLVPITKAA